MRSELHICLHSAMRAEIPTEHHSRVDPGSDLDPPDKSQPLLAANHVTLGKSFNFSVT